MNYVIIKKQLETSLTMYVLYLYELYSKETQLLHTQARQRESVFEQAIHGLMRCLSSLVLWLFWILEKSEKFCDLWSIVYFSCETICLSNDSNKTKLDCTWYNI